MQDWPIPLWGPDIFMYSKFPNNIFMERATPPSTGHAGNCFLISAAQRERWTRIQCPLKSKKRWVRPCGPLGPPDTLQVRILLKEGLSCLHRKEYSLKKEFLEGIQSILNVSKTQTKVCSCHFPYNTPILLMTKLHTGEYRVVQDLRAINNIVQDIHCIVPN